MTLVIPPTNCSHSSHSTKSFQNQNDCKNPSQSEGLGFAERLQLERLERLQIASRNDYEATP